MSQRKSCEHRRSHALSRRFLLYAVNLDSYVWRGYAPLMAKRPKPESVDTPPAEYEVRRYPMSNGHGVYCRDGTHVTGFDELSDAESVASDLNDAYERGYRAAMEKLNAPIANTAPSEPPRPPSDMTENRHYRACGADVEIPVAEFCRVHRDGGSFKLFVFRQHGRLSTRVTNNGVSFVRPTMQEDFECLSLLRSSSGKRFSVKLHRDSESFWLRTLIAVKGYTTQTAKSSFATFDDAAKAAACHCVYHDLMYEICED